MTALPAPVAAQLPPLGTPPSLADYLRLCASGPPAQQAAGMVQFQTALGNRSDLATAAQALLETVDDDNLCDRCWITKRTRRTLQQALGTP